MRLLIVDDEPLARRHLARMLAQIGDVEVVGEAADGVEALELLSAIEVDVMLLDVVMPGVDGLAVARTAARRPHVVFTTAHEQHAVEAFDTDAVDYLLKPIRQRRLERAIDRVRARLLADASPLLEPGQPLLAGQPVRLAASDNGTTHLFDARLIGRFFATNKYTAFISQGREYLIDESLNALEDRLVEHGYVRVHRKELIGLRFIRSVRGAGDGAVVELLDGQCLPVSRRRIGALRRRLRRTVDDDAVGDSSPLTR